MNKVLLTLAVLFSAIFAQARTLTAKAFSGSGNSLNWETPNTWDGGVIPASGDMVIIPANSKVYLRNAFTALKLDLRVSGVLTLTQGGTKLTIGQSGYQYFTSRNRIIVLAPGMIVFDNSGGASKSITVDGNTVANPASGQTVVIGGPLTPGVLQSGDRMAISSSQVNGQNAFEPLSLRTLPVKFLSFAVSRRNSDVLVQWATAEEVNAERFDVEYSTDGRNWTLLTAVAAAGNTDTKQDYSFVARRLPAGTLQFRIKQVDLDGKFTFTDIRTIKTGADAAVRMYGANGRVTLEFAEPVEGAVLRIVNLGGRVLQEQKIVAAGQVVVPTQQKGLCLVTVSTPQGVVATEKVVL